MKTELSFTVDIPKKAHEALRVLADKNRRSVKQEAAYLLVHGIERQLYLSAIDSGLNEWDAIAQVRKEGITGIFSLREMMK